MVERTMQMIELSGNRMDRDQKAQRGELPIYGNLFTSPKERIRIGHQLKNSIANFQYMTGVTYIDYRRALEQDETNRYEV
jgi:hypothetical protein